MGHKSDRALRKAKRYRVARNKKFRELTITQAWFVANIDIPKKKYDNATVAQLSNPSYDPWIALKSRQYLFLYRPSTKQIFYQRYLTLRDKENSRIKPLSSYQDIHQEMVEKFNKIEPCVKDGSRITPQSILGSDLTVWWDATDGPVMNLGSSSFQVF